MVIDNLNLNLSQISSFTHIYGFSDLTKDLRISKDHLARKSNFSFVLFLCLFICTFSNVFLFFSQNDRTDSAFKTLHMWLAIPLWLKKVLYKLLGPLVTLSHFTNFRQDFFSFVGLRCKKQNMP